MTDIEKVKIIETINRAITYSLQVEVVISMVEEIKRGGGIVKACNEALYEWDL